VKRTFDILVASILLLLLFPLLIVLWVLVSLKVERPAIFTQLRPGLCGRPFRLYKFRTMRSLRDNNGLLLPDEARLTRFGSLLRSTSLDELPELWNVLRGEMSLVGPRPLMMEYLPLYTVFQSRRHEVRPGITGWAQVNGRNRIEWHTRFVMDVWYVDNHSFRLDLKILAMTVGQVLKRQDVSAKHTITMPPFQGEQ